MEQNPSVLPKKVWNLVRVVYLMLSKGVSKRKLLLDLNMMIKRGKLAGKALFHHNHSREDFTTDDHLSLTSPPEAAGEYEFSCSNSPSSVTTTKHHPFSLFSHHKKHDHQSLPSKDHVDKMAIEALFKAMEMIHSNANSPSPGLPGFGSTPVVRQLRVTDSPFPLNSSVDDDNHVDEAADQFISRFYSDLRGQN